MTAIMDERLRSIVAARYPDGRPLNHWKGPTSPPAEPQELERWYARVARRRAGTFQAPPAGPLTDTVAIAELHIPVHGSCGRAECAACASGAILARIYRPHALTGPAPAYVNLHGGAFWLGGGEDVIRAGAPAWTAQAAAMQAVIVDVDYRMAPEHKFPTPPEDCYTTLAWLVDHAAELGLDPARVAVGGASAGGALSAAVTLMARDRGGPALVGQVLQIPVTDSHCNSPSMHEFATGHVFERQAAIDMWALYAENPMDLYHPYASPAHATDLSGLPAALVVVGEYDPLRDEGLAYASRLARSGVRTTLQQYPMCHGAALPETNLAVEQEITGFLRQVFAR